jgi:hypothetical protein
MVQAAEARPPYVQFEVRSVEDRQASIDAGHYVGKDIHIAIITPAGSKDRVERVVQEWFAHLENEVGADRFPSSWLSAYRDAYDRWSKGQGEEFDGTAIKSWPVVSPTQVKMLQSLNVHTVEDLASLNEEGILRIGMGGRSLKQKAIDWLESSRDNGKVAMQLEELRGKLDAVLTRNAALEERNAALEAEQAAKKQPGETKL